MELLQHPWFSNPAIRCSGVEGVQDEVVPACGLLFRARSNNRAAHDQKASSPSSANICSPQ